MPDTSDDMDRVRGLVNAMIEAMVDRATREKYSEDKLKSVYRVVVKGRPPPSMWPNTAVAYDRLFGFGENARGYLPRSDARVTKLNSVTKRHLSCICLTLKELSICSNAPEYGDEPVSWLPFLDHALKAITTTLVAPDAVIENADSHVDADATFVSGEAVIERPSQIIKRSSMSNFRYRMPPYFMGREETLSAIDAAFKPDGGALAIAVLHGLRGVGKTTLAFAYAERRADDYRAVWRISAQSEPTMRAELVALGIKLGWVDENEKEDAALAVVMDRLPEDGDGILLIYDNSTDAAILTPYLPKSGSVRILITSTSPASGWRSIAKTVIDLQTWPTEVGAHFLVARSGRAGEDEAATALSEALGGLPLAHEMAAAYCEQCEHPLADYNTLFDVAPAEILDDLRFAPAEYGLTVAKAFALAIDQAAKREPAAALLIVHFAQLAPAPIPLFLFARTFGALGEPLTSMLADDGLERTVAALRAFALIDREEILDQRDTSIATHAIRLHRLVREVAAARCSIGERDQIRQAFVKLMKILYPFDPRSPVSWRNCALLTPHLLDICKTAVTEGCAALLNSVGLYYLGLQALSAAQPLFERALKIREQLLGPEDLLSITVAFLI